MENKRSRKTPSQHDTFPKFLDCVSEFSVPEELSLRGGTWMGGPPGPCHKLSTMQGKEPLKYIWDHLGEFIKKGRKEIQVYLERNLDETTSKIIANAVQSCIWEHSEELKSDDGQAEEVKQEIQDPQPGIPVPTKESEEQGAEGSATNGSGELDTVKGIDKAALEAGDPDFQQTSTSVIERTMTAMQIGRLAGYSGDDLTVICIAVIEKGTDRLNMARLLDRYAKNYYRQHGSHHYESASTWAKDNPSAFSSHLERLRKKAEDHLALNGHTLANLIREHFKQPALR